MPAFQQNMATSVPTAPPQMQSGPADVSQQLDAIFSQNSQELQKLAVAATTPVAGPHATSVPASLNRPETGFQGAPLDHREVVGAGNARGQGIGNSIVATLNTIGAVKNTMDNKKKVEIASSTQQLVTAQAAADQAKQIMAANPDQNSTAYKQAKEAFDHNTQIQGTILTGKHGKDIMKGFNIDYTDPSANKTIQHDAVAMGKKRAEAAAKFNEGTPTTMAPDQQAQARYQAALTQRKDQIETVRAMGPVWAAQLRSEGALNVESIRAATDLRKAAVEAGAKLDEQTMKNYQDDKNNEARMALEQYKAASDRALESMKTGKPTDVLKEFNEAQKNYETAITENQKSRQALNNELDKNPSSSRQIEIRRQLQGLDAVDEQAKNAFTLNRNVIAKGLGISVDDTRLQVPTIHVGDGVQNATAAKQPSPDLDPRTNKPWKSGVSTTDRILIKGHYSAGILQHDAEQVVGNINRGVKKLEHFFDPGKTD